MKRVKWQDEDSDNFRCPGCETPTKDGRYCRTCQDEYDYPLNKKESLE